MQNAINLGECLFVFCGFWIVVYGLWRANSPRSAAAIGRMFSGLKQLHMSSSETPVKEVAQDVPSTGIGTGTDEIEEVATSDDIQLPTAVPLSRHMGVVDIIVLLASQKKGDTYRYTASKIYALTGGNHNDVLELIRQVQGREKRNGTRVAKPDK